MSQLFKRVAIVAGTGLAAAVASVSSAPVPKKRDAPGQNQVPEAESEVSVSSRIPRVDSSAFGIPADDVLYLEPLFDRLEAIERRLDTPPPAPPPAPEAPEPDLTEVYSQLDALRRDVPGIVSRLVQQAQQAARKNEPNPEALGALIEGKVAIAVSERISGLERALQDQASSIGALLERVNQSESNMQRLVTVISRLIEGPGLGPGLGTTPPPRAAHAAASFEAHLSDAMNGEPAPPERDTNEFRSRIIQEPDSPARKPRVPMSRIS